MANQAIRAPSWIC